MCVKVTSVIEAIRLARELVKTGRSFEVRVVVTDQNNRPNHIVGEDQE